MVKFYEWVCKAEEFFVKWALVVVAVLIFVSAIARTLKQPLNWGTDISLLLFAWIIFLGADVALRHGEFVNVDIIIKRFPQRVERFFLIFWNIVIIGFLFILIWFGIPLVIESANRIFNTLGISYSWAIVSVPIGAFLMIITTCIKIYHIIKQKNMEA